jgi:hypothetical protein
MRSIYDKAKALGEKYGKPVINNETCCLCRANPYDMTLEILEEYGFGWYLFELIIGYDGWNRVHGIVYPDGTIRDPSIVAALFGFYRNRSENIIRPDINKENYVTELIARTSLIMKDNCESGSAGRRDYVNELLSFANTPRIFLRPGAYGYAVSAYGKGGGVPA